MWNLGVKDDAVCKCVTRGALWDVKWVQTGRRLLRGCMTPSGGCSRRRKKGHDSIECIFYFLSRIGAQRGLSEGREGYQASANTDWWVDNKIEAKIFVLYMGTWDERS